VGSQLSELRLSEHSIIRTPKVTVLLEYFRISVCSIRVNNCSIRVFGLYINQWTSSIWTNSLIWTRLPNFRNKGIRIMGNPLYYIYFILCSYSIYQCDWTRDATSFSNCYWFVSIPRMVFSVVFYGDTGKDLMVITSFAIKALYF